MLLVLFLIGLGTAVAVDPPKPEPKPEPEPVKIVGMKTDPVKFDVAVSPDALVAGDPGAEKRARQAIERAIGPIDRGQNEAALVLIFGGAESAAPGQRVAEALRPQMSRTSSGLFPKDTPSRFFWDGSLEYGEVRLEVFLFAKEETPAP
ncbi:hypothetical protein [Nocardioides ochotonae]|uniref:hypothetical protein n=1 Tax=Nocardioides ochotonae TaxID=2685869 RepID=UPI00140B5476|nr:hypothetical protein [Nocardioides ochotonae]